MVDLTPEIMERLRERAAGLSLVTWSSEGEIAFCGEVDGEYVGWVPRAVADGNGWSYRGTPDPDLQALISECERLSTYVTMIAAGMDHDHLLKIEREYTSEAPPFRAPCVKCNNSGVIAAVDGEAMDCPYCDGPSSRGTASPQRRAIRDEPQA